MNSFVALLALAPVILAKPSPDWISDVIDTEMVPANFNKTLKYLAADGNYNNTLGCTESAYIDNWGVTYTIKSANYPGPIAPNERCTFNFMLPESMEGVNATTYFWCNDFNLNTINKYQCGYRGLSVYNDEFQDFLCDFNYNGTQIEIPVSGNLTFEYVPGGLLRGGRFDCSFYMSTYDNSQDYSTTGEGSDDIDDRML